MSNSSFPYLGGDAWKAPKVDPAVPTMGVGSFVMKSKLGDEFSGSCDCGLVDVNMGGNNGSLLMEFSCSILIFMPSSDVSIWYGASRGPVAVLAWTAFDAAIPAAAGSVYLEGSGQGECVGVGGNCLLESTIFGFLLLLSTGGASSPLVVVLISPNLALKNQNKEIAN